MPKIQTRQAQDKQSEDQYPHAHEDDITRRRAVRRTWLLLGAAMLAYAVWFGLIYLLEPGIR